MNIVPVLDLRGGLVVRAKGGRRGEYAPIQSPLCPSPLPGDVARAIAETFEPPHCYVADLDAIEGGEPAWNEYEQIASAGFALHVDAGVHAIPGLSRLIQFASERQVRLHPIIGLETLREPALLEQLANAGRSADCAFSLDLRDGRPLSTSQKWREAPAMTIVDCVVEARFERLIVLDLARVGGASGVGTLDLCRQIHGRHPRLSIWAGGGVSGVRDLEDLAAAGCDGALVASALHDGRLTVSEVQALSRRT